MPTRGLHPSKGIKGWQKGDRLRGCVGFKFFNRVERSDKRINCLLSLEQLIYSAITFGQDRLLEPRRHNTILNKGTLYPLNPLSVSDVD